MSVLLVLQTAPEDPTNGGSLRWWNMFEGQVDILCLSRNSDPKNSTTATPGILPWRRIEVLEDAHSLCRIGRRGNDLATFVHAHRDLGIRLAAAIARYDRGDLRLVIGDYALALLTIASLGMPFVFDAVDSSALYFWRRAVSLAPHSPVKSLNSLAWFRTYRGVEATIARHAALYIVAAEADRRCVLAAYPQARVVTIPNGTSWIQQPPLERNGAPSTPVIAFHGGMTWDPNRTAASYLATKVFPRVRAAVPQARLRIAGGPVSSALAALARQPGVEVAGFVSGLREWLRECHVYAMPMTQGSGVKNKLMEAMAAGLPIVTNSLGAEALPDRCRETVVVADGRRALARAIADLLHDPARRAVLRAAARSAAEREFGWADLGARYRKAVLAAGRTHGDYGSPIAR
jgi:glycosyltransferase involved in cell wall biosynthesis